MNNSNMNIKLSKKVFFINFNQDRSCFCLGTDEGYEIYNCNPLKKIFSKKIGENGICFISMLFRTNILALVKKNTKTIDYNENKVIIWDDKLNTKTGEIEFKKKIKNICIRKDFIIVSLDDIIYIYYLQDLKLFKKINTFLSNKGLFSITYQDYKFLLVCCGDKVGEIKLFDIKKNKNVVIKAHETNLNFITLSKSGNIVATCSEKGTIIRIFHTLTNTIIKELRRGSDITKINWIEISPCENMILCRSQKGTIHIFNTDYKKTVIKNKNKLFTFAKYFKNYLPKYFSSEWSFAHFHYPNMRTISTFTTDYKHIIVISFNGNFYKVNFTNNEYVIVTKKNLD